jgi:hypothetical protein
MAYDMGMTANPSANQLKLLDFDREATFVTHLDSDTVLVCRSLTEFMLMLCILPLLPDAFPSPFAQLLQPLFELLILLFLLLCRPFLPFRVQRLWRAPLLPGKFLDLVPAIEHHVCER